MLRVFISGPYSADTEFGVAENIQRAREEAILWWQAGAAVFCPHMNSAHFGGLVQQENFYKADLDFLERCQAISMLPRFQRSLGAIAEHEFAKERGLMIFYRVPGSDLPMWRLEERSLTRKALAKLCEKYSS